MSGWHRRNPHLVGTDADPNMINDDYRRLVPPPREEGGKMLSAVGFLWAVKRANKVVILNTSSSNREAAKRQAFGILGGDPEQYTVEPLTNGDDQIWLSIVVGI